MRTSHNVLTAKKMSSLYCLRTHFGPYNVVFTRTHTHAHTHTHIPPALPNNGRRHIGFCWLRSRATHFGIFSAGRRVCAAAEMCCSAGRGGPITFKVPRTCDEIHAIISCGSSVSRRTSGGSGREWVRLAGQGSHCS